MLQQPEQQQQPQEQQRQPRQQAQQQQPQQQTFAESDSSMELLQEPGIRRGNAAVFYPLPGVARSASQLAAAHFAYG